MSEQPSIGWSFLRSRRWLGYAAMLAVFSIACVLLGNWQFDRRAEARAEIDRIDQNYDATPVQLESLVAELDAFDIDEMKWRQVELHGVYEGEAFLARNRPGASGVGSNVVQAFRLDSGRVIFIDRGWVPVTGADEAFAELPAAPTGDVTVIARLRASEPSIAGRSSSGSSVASIDLGELSLLTNTVGSSYTGAFGQLVSETPAGETGVLPQRPERDEGPHLSYALQWYVFIIIAFVGVGYAARKEYRGLNEGDESVLREDARRAERQRKRGPTDADEEDAILDA